MTIGKLKNISKSCALFAIFVCYIFVCCHNLSAQTFVFPKSGTRAVGITAGADGAIWFTENTGNVGRIATDGVITEFLLATPNYQMTTITSGPDGAIWFVEANSIKIGHIAANGAIAEFPLPITPASTPVLAVGGITTGADGALWFTNADTNSIWRMTTTGSTTSFPLPCYRSEPGKIVSGPDGALWFSLDNPECHSIGRITTTGVISQFPLPLDISAGSLTVGSDGAFWFSDSGTRKIGRITTDGLVSEFPIANVFNYSGTGPQIAEPAGPNYLTAGPDGAIWYINTSAFAAVRVSPNGTFTKYQIPYTDLYVGLLATSLDGTIWFGLSNGFGRLNFTQVSVDVAGPGLGKVQGGGLNCGNGAIICDSILPVVGDTSKFPFVPNDVDLTAIPAPGSSFLGWTGGCAGSFDCVFAPAGSALVSAIFLGPSPPALYTSILPVSRSIQVGASATAFATIINAGPGTATDCAIAKPSTTPSSFFYQATSSATNAPIAPVNTPVNIPAGGSQSFIIGFKPVLTLSPKDTRLIFSCSNSNPAATYNGINTLLLSASTSPVPDVIALAATLTNDGIVDVPGNSGTGVFAVASINIGASANIKVTADTGSASLPLVVTLCQTDPATAQCLSPPGSSTMTIIGTNATPTFSIFATASAQIPFAPATSRVFVRFTDANGVTRGSTSVAVRTQ